jgi:hypothetical protein
LTAQSLEQLDTIEDGLLGTTLANIDTLAVFQTSGRDARELLWELGDEQLKVSHIVNLPDHTCLLKTQRDGKPLPVMRVDLLDTPEGDGDTAWAVRERSYRYTVGAAEATRQYREYIERAYGIDLESFRRRLESWLGLEDKMKEEKERQAMEKKKTQSRLPQTAVEAPEPKQLPLFLASGVQAKTPVPRDMETQKTHRRSRKGKR